MNSLWWELCSLVTEHMHYLTTRPDYIGTPIEAEVVVKVQAVKQYLWINFEVPISVFIVKV